MDSYVDLFQSHDRDHDSQGQSLRGCNSCFTSMEAFIWGASGPTPAILTGTSIEEVECIEYPELGMEAIWKIEVEDFPAFILLDNKGNDFFAEIRNRCASCAIAK